MNSFIICASLQKFLFLVMILTAIMEGISKASAVLSALMKVYTIPYNDRGHINVMVVLQSCTDSLQVMADSPTETYPTSSDGTFDVGNIKVEEDLDMQEEEEVNVKTEKGISSEEEECIDIKDEQGIRSEEEEEEDIDTKEHKDVDVKEEVRCGDKV